MNRNHHGFSLIEADDRHRRHRYWRHRHFELQQYVQRSRITELSQPCRTCESSEQYFQDNQTYVGAVPPERWKRPSTGGATIRTSPSVADAYGDRLCCPGRMATGQGVREDERFPVQRQSGQPEGTDDEQCCWQGESQMNGSATCWVTEGGGC